MEQISWLLENADPSLEFQVRRDLLQEPTPSLAKYQNKIGKQGFVKLLLEKRKPDGHWGHDVYNPKWTCTHYVLFELMQLGISNENAPCIESAGLLLDYPAGNHGGINYAKTVADSDLCINGMILNITSYFGLALAGQKCVIDYLLSTQMTDGGWNCEYLHGATHSSLHTTISVLEGISRFLETEPDYKRKELEKVRNKGNEFILKHELFKSSTTGEIIKDEFFKYCFPVRWKYDILRCLDYFQNVNIPYDKRMKDAISIIHSSQNKNGRWKSFSQPGKTFYEIENKENKGKWNTLRALRGLGKYGF
jgi:hypothetical protein